LGSYACSFFLRKKERKGNREGALFSKKKGKPPIPKLRLPFLYFLFFFFSYPVLSFFRRKKEQIEDFLEIFEKRKAEKKEEKGTNLRFAPFFLRKKGKDKS
jgi:hypothetical protein